MDEGWQKCRHPEKKGFPNISESLDFIIFLPEK
jgi:hypothetical protein